MWGLLRDFDVYEVMRSLNVQGKPGWEPDPRKSSTENLQNALMRYTMGRGQPLTWMVRRLNRPPGTYEATLGTCLSEARYVGHGPNEIIAKRAAADGFLKDPNVCEVLKWVPPTQSDIRSKCQVFGLEKRQCKALGVSADLINQVVQKRMREVTEKYHEDGYHTDIWDGNS